MNIEDNELLDLLTKIILTASILIICVFFFTLILSRKNSINPSYLEDKINGKDDFVLLIRGKDCSRCKDIKNEFKKNGIRYYTLNVDKNKRSDIIIRKLDISKNDIVLPMVVNIKDGKPYSLIVDIKKMDDLNEFIGYNNLTN